MVAPPASFVSPARRGSSAAFGGVIELSQLLIGSDDDAGPVVCVACRTINRASAHVCKGCDGKLPAFYAASGDAVGPAMLSGDRPFAAEPAPTPRVRALMNRLAPWSTVVWATAALIVLYALFAVWYAAYTASARRAPAPVPAAFQAAAAAPAPLPAIAAAPEPNPARTIDALNVTLQESPPERAIADAAPAPRAEARRVRGEPVQRVMPAQPGDARQMRPAAARAHSGDPLAACRALNVFARAVCMNNSCAQRSSARHPLCVQVVQQRRIDEARRNPTMLN